MKLGFTGTRKDPTDEQLKWLESFLIDRFPESLHHGACVGSDHWSHKLALKVGVKNVIVHPPIKMHLAVPFEELRANPNASEVTILEQKDYHARNRDIVNAADILAALVDGPERPHSGTWYTINYAKGHSVPWFLCYPDGTLEWGK